LAAQEKRAEKQDRSPNRLETARRLLNQGGRLLQDAKPAEAIRYLERALALDAQNVAVRINLGGAYVLTGRHREAVPLLEGARDVEPDNPMIWTNLGAAYLGNRILATPEQQTQAIRAFERALELDPMAPSLHYNIGLIHMDRGDTAQALTAFRRAIQVNPADRDAHTWLRKLVGE